MQFILNEINSKKISITIYKDGHDEIIIRNYQELMEFNNECIIIDKIKIVGKKLFIKEKDCDKIEIIGEFTSIEKNI